MKKGFYKCDKCGMVLVNDDRVERPESKFLRSMNSRLIEKDVVEESIKQALKTARIQLNLTDGEGNAIVDVSRYLEDARKAESVLNEFQEWLDETNQIIWGQDKTSFSIYKKLQILKKKHGLPFDEKIGI